MLVLAFTCRHDHGLNIMDGIVCKRIASDTNIINLMRMGDDTAKMAATPSMRERKETYQMNVSGLECLSIFLTI